MKGLTYIWLYRICVCIAVSRCDPHPDCCLQQAIRACMRPNVSAGHQSCCYFIQHLSPVSVDNMQSVVLFRISIQRSMSAFRHLCRVQSGKLAGDSMAGHHDSDDNVSARIFQGAKVSTDMLFCSARIRPGRPARPQRFLFPGRMYAPFTLSETPCYECRTAAMNGFLFCTAGRTG